MPRVRSTRCTGFAGDRGDPPGVRKRQRRGGRAERKPPARCRENAATTSHFIVSVGDSAAEIDSAAKEAEAHGERVAYAGKAVTIFAQKLKTRCAVLLGQDGREDRRKQERLPCNLKIEIQTAARPGHGGGLRDFHGRHPDLRSRTPSGCR